MVGIITDFSDAGKDAIATFDAHISGEWVRSDHIMGIRTSETDCTGEDCASLDELPPSCRTTWSFSGDKYVGYIF